MQKNKTINTVIKVDSISKTEQEIIARSFLSLVEDYFKNPDVKQDYEKWLKKRNNNFVSGIV